MLDEQQKPRNRSCVSGVLFNYLHTTDYVYREYQSAVLVGV